MMIGFLYAIIGATAYGLLEGVKKRATNFFDIKIIFWALVTFATPVFGVALMIDGIPEIEPRFWIVVAIDTPLLIFTNLLLIKAEKISPISATLPLMSLTPVFLVFTSFFLLGELPNAYGLLGILLVVSGALLLKGEELRRGLGNELRHIFADKGARYVLIVALLWSFNGVFSKMGIESSSIWMYVFVGSCIECLFMTFWLLTRHKKLFVQTFNRKSYTLIAASLINAFALFMYLAAIEKILVSYVIALKRAGFIVGALVLGATVFKEKNIRYRIGGAALMIIGILFILILH